MSDGDLLVGVAEWEPLKTAARSGLGHWPVLDLERRRLVGVIGRGDGFAAYDHHVG